MSKGKKTGLRVIRGFFRITGESAGFALGIVFYGLGLCLRVMLSVFWKACLVGIFGVIAFPVVVFMILCGAYQQEA